jgi:hypothetical protein
MPRLKEQQLLENLAVSPDHPIVQGVLEVAKQQEELCLDNTLIARQSDTERAYHAGAAASIRDFVSLLLGKIEDAHEAKTGEKKKSKQS